MSSRQKVVIWLVLVVLVLVSCFGACGAYIRMGTDPIAGYVCPDGKWEALVMVHNGGAMDRFSTQISVVSTTNPVVEQLALYRKGNAFIADDDHGAVPSDDRGQIDIKVVWKSPRELTVSYPAGTRVFEQARRIGAVTIRYVVTK